MTSGYQYYQTTSTALTEAFVKSLKPYDKTREVHCSITKGLYVKIQPTGEKSYYVVCRIDGKRVRTRLGKVADLKLANRKDDATGEAVPGVVTIAKKIIGQAADGLNQNEERRKRARAKAAAKAKSVTLKAFLKDPYGPWVKASNKAGKATLKRLETAFVTLQNTALSKLTPDALDKWRAARLADAVTSSSPVIRKAPSPGRATTSRPGLAKQAPMAAGTE